MKSAILLLITLLSGAAFAVAQQGESDEACKQYLQTPLPAEAQEIPPQKNWPDCDSYKSYSGLGTQADFTAARKCAWKERVAQQAGLAPTYTVASLFGGSAMLTVLYANGEEVEQNKPLALRFACESEMEGRKEDILALPDEPHITQKKFRYCDEASTTFEMNFCAAYDGEIAAQNRQNALDRLSQNWPARDRDAFKSLQKASEEYVRAHGSGEVYQGGTIRVLRTDGVEEHQRDKFVKAIEDFEGGHLPRGTQADFQKVDADLNETYRKALALAAAQDFTNDDGLIKPDGIRQAERAWLKYRDAWIEFAGIHYPKTASDAWLTLLTSNRVWHLRATMCDVGWADSACKRE